MFDRLQAVEDRYDRLNELLSDPSIVNDLNKLREYSKEQSDIQDTVLAYREYKVVQVQLKDAKEMRMLEETGFTAEPVFVAGERAIIVACVDAAT